MKKWIRGGIYLESLIGLTLVLILITPTILSFYNIKRGYGILNRKLLIENEIEKIRGFYKKNGLKREYKSENKELLISITKDNIYENLYNIMIVVTYKEVKRESSLYVYE